MDFETVIPYVAGLVVLAAVLLAMRRSGQATTAAGALTQVQEAAAIARELVAAAEQLWRTGRLPKDDRLGWVMDQLEELYPGLDPDLLAATVEAAVYWLRLAQQRIEAQDAPPWKPETVAVAAPELGR